MSRSRLIDQWERDLPGLSDGALRERLELARDAVHESRAKGRARNPKAARMWQGKVDAVLAELARRGMTEY
ncbi:MAG: hypothetical protein ACTHQ3_23190 [Motilibacteraceae bacterium]